MKIYWLLAILLLASCGTSPTYHVPAGYKTCQTDYDCLRGYGEFCGFVGVNTYAVCRK